MENFVGPLNCTCG